MSEFSDLAKKAEGYAEEHPEQADKAINEAEKMAEDRTGHQHDDQIEHAGDAVEQHFGGGQNQDQDQDQNQDQNQQGNQN